MGRDMIGWDRIGSDRLGWGSWDAMRRDAI